MARKAGQGKEEEESKARQQEEKTPVRDEEKKPACHGGAHHVVEQEPLNIVTESQVIERVDLQIKTAEFIHDESVLTLLFIQLQEIIRNRNLHQNPYKSALPSTRSRATDFFELTLYPATLLKVFISCKSSLVEFLGSLKYTIISSANSEILTSSFLIYIPLISLCCRIALARTSSTMLNRNVPCIPTLSKAFIMKGC
ncbi:hypothetical protein STEG23_020323 [Scotinomys teguina]